LKLFDVSGRVSALIAVDQLPLNDFVVEQTAEIVRLKSRRMASERRPWRDGR
jgi:hypothetical protein